MPYEVTRDGDTYVCRKKGGKALGRHATKAEAEAQMRALYAGERRSGAGKSGELDDAGELLVYAGGEVKALDDEGRFGGYLVRYGSPELPDRTATKDYMTPETNFGPFIKAPIEVYFHHSLATVKGEPNDLEDVIGSGTIKADDEGLWLDGRVDLSVPGVSRRWEALKASDDAFGLSSGAVSHLVRRVPQPNGTHWIRRWPIVEASLTPEPGEARTAAVALKSLIDADPVAGSLLIDRSRRLVADGRELLGLYAKALDQRRADGRSLSPEKLDELKSLQEPLAGLVAEVARLVDAARPKADPTKLRALDERLARFKQTIGVGNP